MTAAAVAPAVANADAREENPWARAWRRLRRRKGAMFGLVVSVLFVLVAILAPLISPYDPIATSFTQVHRPPSWAHWLGTDEVGRDVLTRIIWGARASLSAGLVSVGIALGIGVRSACWRAMPAAGSMPCCRASSMRCWRFPS